VYRVETLREKGEERRRLRFRMSREDEEELEYYTAMNAPAA